MAGFSNIGVPGFTINPPLVSRPSLSPQALGLSIIRPQRNPAGFFNLYENRGFNTGADQSNQHAANVYMQQMGYGDVGQDKSAFGGTMPSYGFTPEDYNRITRFLANPMNQGNVNDYMGIVNRLKAITGTNPQFSMWDQTSRDQWARNFPLNLGSAFGTIPPPVLQSQHIPVTNDSNLRF